MAWHICDSVLLQSYVLGVFAVGMVYCMLW